MSGNARNFWYLCQLPMFFKRKTIIEFCEWSKQAEWRDGERKTAFIRNDWVTYIKLFLEDRKRPNLTHPTSDKN